MEIIGLDLHKRERQLSIKADDGTITDRRIATSRERFSAVLGGRPPARILLEASTERQLGHITKSGNGRMRWLLVEAAWTILRSTSAETAALRAWTLQVAQRRGKRIAVVARARREPRRTDARIEMTEEGPCSGRKSSRSIGKPTRTSQPLGTHAFARGPGSSYVRGQVTPTSP